MRESTPELKRRLDQIERVNIPHLVSRLDPLRSEPHRRRATLRELHGHLDAVDAASGDPVELAALAEWRGGIISRTEDALARTDPDNAHHRFLEHDLQLWRDVEHLIRNDEADHARSSYLRSEERQIANTDRGQDGDERQIEAYQDRALAIRDELRRRGETL